MTAPDSARAKRLIAVETRRLRLRALHEDDAVFVLRLVNEPTWLRFIGDKSVRNLDDARRYLREGPLSSYAQHGHGSWLVQRLSDDLPLGMCGLIRRKGLPIADLGFAFLPEHEGQGYAHEAASAVLRWAQEHLALPRVLAITSPDNQRSIRLLEKLGFTYQESRRLTESQEAVSLFALDLLAA